MARPRVTCHNCRVWDREARRCRAGKANPPRKHEAQTVAEMLGPRALCLFSPYREPLILRMQQPHRPFVWSLAERHGPALHLEVEVLPDED